MTKLSHMTWSDILHNPFTGEVAIHRNRGTNIDAWWTGTQEYATSSRFKAALEAIGLHPNDRLEKGSWFSERLSLLRDAIELQSTDSQNRDHSFFFLPPEAPEEETWKEAQEKSGELSELETWTYDSNYVYEIPTEGLETRSLWDPISGVQWVKNGKLLKDVAVGWWKIKGNKIEALVRNGPLAEWWEEEGGEELSDLDDDWTHDRLWEVLADWQSTSPMKKFEDALPGHIAVMKSAVGGEMETEIAIFRCGGYIPPKKAPDSLRGGQ